MSGTNGELRRRYCLGKTEYNFVIPSFKHGLSQNASHQISPLFQNNCHINIMTSYLYSMSLVGWLSCR